MAVDMVTSAEVKTALAIDGTNQDTAIAAAIPAASRAVNNRCGRELTPKTAAATRTFQVPAGGFGRPRIVDFHRYDLRSATAIRLHPESSSPVTLTANVDYALWPIGGAPLTSTYLGLSLSSYRDTTSDFALRFGYAQLEVAGAWGAWDTADVPEEVKRACIIAVGSWLDKAVAAYGDRLEDDTVRSVLPSFFTALALPKASWSLLQDAGLTRSTTV